MRLLQWRFTKPLKQLSRVSLGAGVFLWLFTLPGNSSAAKTFQIYDVSLSARVMHARPVTCGRPTHASKSLVVIAVDRDTRILSPDGRQVHLRQLRPGMHVRVRGEQTSPGSILAAEVRLAKGENLICNKQI